MKYILKSGILYKDAQNSLMRIKNSMSNSNKKILSLDDQLILEACVRTYDSELYDRSDVRTKTYILTDQNNERIAQAYPQYALGEDPKEIGWPIHRMPRVYEAKMEIEQKQYVLTMINNQNYSLNDGHKDIVKILHRGINGGWTIEDDYGFKPEILCGIFVFCRYIEQENELVIV